MPINPHLRQDQARPGLAEVSGKLAIKCYQPATTIILLDNLTEETTTSNDQDCYCGKRKQLNKNFLSLLF